MKMGEASLQDTIILDGLTDAFYQYHMGITGKWVTVQKMKRFTGKGGRIHVWEISEIWSFK